MASLAALPDRIARVLVEDHGLVPGNRVLLRSANNPMLVACWCAVLKAGGICVTTMQLLRARELVYIVEKSEIRHALCDLSLAEEMEETCRRKSEIASTLYFTPTSGGDGTLDRAIEGKPGDFTSCDTAADDIIPAFGMAMLKRAGDRPAFLIEVAAQRY